MFTNISEKYGEAVEVTIQDYQELNPGGKFEIVGDEIRELLSDKPGDYEVVATR